MVRNTLLVPSCLVLLICLIPGPSAWAQAPAPTPTSSATDEFVISGTLEAVPGYPRVHVQLSQGNRILVGKGMKISTLTGIKDLSDLDSLLDSGTQLQSSFTAFLDTGASAHVLSLSTTQRFKIQPESGAVYHETGLHGPIAMGVSRPYTLALSSSNGKQLDEPGRFQVIQPQTRMLFNPKPPSNPLVQLAMGEVNVIGMPTIRQLVVEIDPTPMLNTGGLNTLLGDLDDIDGLLSRLGDLGAGPAVRLHKPDTRPPKVDIVIPLRLVNFARRRNPDDRGPLPALSENFVIEDIEMEVAGKRVSGDWLLDTGAPASMISTEQAITLGLFDQNGQPQRPPDFSLPLGGISGGVKTSPGFRIERLRVPVAGDKTVTYLGAYVIVHDVSTELDDGEHITLDGIFGTNFLLPTVAGLNFGLPTNMGPTPYRRIWIDGPRGQLLLELP